MATHPGRTSVDGSAVATMPRAQLREVMRILSPALMPSFLASSALMTALFSGKISRAQVWQEVRDWQCTFIL